MVLYISYYSETVFFTHTHYTPYGCITHSHPFKAGHCHTAAAYQTIYILSAIFFYTTTLAAICFILRKIRTILSNYHFIRLYKSAILISSRAPPVY